MFCKYADDTYIIIPASNSHTRTTELEHIDSWAKHNNLTLNRAKTLEVIFADKKSKRIVMPPPPLPGITRRTTLKILGVTITNGLSTAEHIQGVINVMFTNSPCTKSPPQHAALCSSWSFPSGGHCQTLLCIQCLVGFLHSWWHTANSSLHSPQLAPRILQFRPCRHHEHHKYSRWHPVPSNSYQSKSRPSPSTPWKS